MLWNRNLSVFDKKGYVDLETLGIKEYTSRYVLEVCTDKFDGRIYSQLFF